MNRNLILIGIVALLGVVIWWLSTPENSTLSEKSASFSVKNTDRIHKIFLADLQGNTVTLNRHPKKGWMVNDKFQVRQSVLKNLMTTLRDVEIKYPVPQNSRERVVKNLSSNHIKVELYNKSGDNFKTFFVGGTTDRDRGTYMLIKGADKPYVTHLPGFEGYLTPRFPTKVNTWRSRVVIDAPPKQIQSVKLKYPRQPQHSFNIQVVSKDSYAIRPLNRPPVKDKQPYQPGIKKYLTFFQNVGAEGYINDHKKKDSILSTTPHAILRVTLKNEEKQWVKAFPRKATERTKKAYTKQGTPKKLDPMRMYGLVNNGNDFAFIQVCPRRCVFGKLFRKYTDFFVKPKQEQFK